MIKSLSKLIPTVRLLNLSPRIASRSLFTTVSDTSNTSTTLTNNSNQEDSNELDRLYSKVELELKGIDPAVLKSFSTFAITAATHLGIEVGQCFTPRKADHHRFTLLKSVHIYKKHRVQYEVRTHFRFLQFHKLTGSTMDTFLEYVERNLPEGCAIKTTKIEIQQLPEHLKKPPTLTVE